MRLGWHIRLSRIHVHGLSQSLCGRISALSICRTGARRWSQAGFFNPRKGLIYQFEIDKIIPLMSGGRLTSEVFQEMVEYFCARDIQLDSKF